MIFKVIFAALLAVGIFSAVWFVIHRSPTPTVADVGRKAVAGVFFVMMSVTMVLFSFSNLTAEKIEYICKFRAIFLIAVGAFFGLIGDILLDLKCVYKKENDFFLVSGFLGFLFGHIFYIASLISSGNLMQHSTALLILTGISVIIGIIAISIEKILRVDFGRFKPIVAVYSGIIFLAVNISILNLFVNGFVIGNITVYLGLLSILASDFVLNGTYFGKDKNTKVYIVLNHFFYYLGQYLIAFSTYFLAHALS